MALEINPTLDIDYLAQVYGDDATIIHLIFDAFLSDSLPRWIALKSSIQSRNLDEAASIVHGLKPSFTMAGITWLRPQVEDFERAIKAQATNAELQGFYTKISKELDILKPILETESVRLSAM